MEKLFLIVVLTLSYMGLSAQSVDDWFPNRTKVNFKDSTNFAKTPLINGVDTVAKLSDVRTVGTVGTDMSAVRVEIGDSINTLRPLIIYVADTAVMLDPYVREAEVTAITDLKLDITDTTSMLDPYILRSDTADMLSKYIRIAETLDMLDPYLLEIDAADTYAPLASPTFTGTVTLPTATSIGDVNSTEIGYVNGVTSSIQTQLNSKVNVIDTSSMLAPYILDSKVQSDINDTITARLAGGTVGVALADSNDYKPYHYATPSFVKDLISTGGDGSLVEAVLQFTVDETGAPSAGDSTLTHTNFTGNAIDIYRDGAKQYKNTTATNTVEGFRLNTNTITVNPVFQANEQIIVSILDPVTRTYLSLEGEESALLDSIAVYYKLDETSGNTGDDANDIQDATISAYATASNDHAKFNYGRHVGYKGSIRSPYNASVNPTGEFTISMWIWADSIGTTNDYIFATSYSGTPAQPVQVYLDTDSKIVFRTYNTEGTRYGSISSGALSDSTLYHIVLVHRGNGYTNKIYVNGIDVTAEQGGVNYTFSGSLFQASGSLFYANYTTNGLLNFRGYIDECGLWHQAFTPADVTLLNGLSTSYPFIE